MSTVGLELGAEVVRAVLQPRRGDAITREYGWSPERATDCVERIVADLGSGHTVALAVGLAHLSVQRVTLPPSPPATLRQMLRIEPDRWFPLASDGELAVAVAAHGTLAFACDGVALQRWVSACGALGTVISVEPAPVALARTLRRDGSAVLDDEQAPGWVEVREGTLTTVRRGGCGEAPSDAIGSDAFQVAHGAATVSRATDETQLRTTDMERQATARARQRLLAWSVTALAAVIVAIWSLGISRDRTLAALDVALVEARAAAVTGRASLDRAFALDREADAIVALRADRPDDARALAALGTRLPRAAVAQRVRVDGREWQVDGNAVTAAAVLQSLAAEPTFGKVRFLAPSTRYQEAAGNRETWSIGFTLR